MELVKATIEILDQALHARMPRTIAVQFNPNELCLKKHVDIAEIGIPGLDAPILQFVKGGGETLQIELFCDTTKSGMEEDVEDVRKFTAPIRELARVQPETHAPPRIRFRWGEGILFDGVVSHIEQKFSLFNPGGIPLRATLRLFLLQYSEPKTLLPEGRQTAISSSLEASGRLGSDRYIPVVEVRRRHQTTTTLLGGDLLSAVASDRLDSGDSFELTINSADDERRDVRGRGVPEFMPGERIEVAIGYRGKKQRFWVGGRIESVREILLGGGRPTLIVSGGSTISQREERAMKRIEQSAVCLTQGESLIEFERQITLWSRKFSQKTKWPVPKENNVVTATGVSIGIPDLQPGNNIEVQGVNPGFGSIYYVTAVTHTLDSNGYRTHFECREENG